MRLLILGAGGFIGTHLVRNAVEQGHEVIALCRSGHVDGFVGPTYTWELDQSVPAVLFDKVDCVIHLAHDFNGEIGARMTQKATIEHVKHAREAGVRKQIFFSSYSAGAHATSLYGRAKFAVEEALSGYADIVIVRPGLVLGNGGLYGRIVRVARSFLLLPLPDGGRGLLPVIDIARLCRETLALSKYTKEVGEVNLFYPRLRTLRELVLQAASESGRCPWILNVPSVVITAFLRVAAFIHLPLPVNVDNFKGFLANQEAKHLSAVEEEKVSS